MATKSTTDNTGPKGPEDVDVSDVPSNRPEDATLASIIESANQELEEKRDVLHRLQESRQLASVLTKKVGSPEQVAWVRFYLPRKARKRVDSAA